MKGKGKRKKGKGELALPHISVAGRSPVGIRGKGKGKELNILSPVSCLLSSSHF